MFRTLFLVVCLSTVGPSQGSLTLAGTYTEPGQPPFMVPTVTVTLGGSAGGGGQQLSFQYYGLLGSVPGQPFPINIPAPVTLEVYYRTMQQAGTTSLVEVVFRNVTPNSPPFPTNLCIRNVEVPGFELCPPDGVVPPPCPSTATNWFCWWELVPNVPTPGQSTWSARYRFLDPALRQPQPIGLATNGGGSISIAGPVSATTGAPAQVTLSGGPILSGVTGLWVNFEETSQTINIFGVTSYVGSPAPFFTPFYPSPFAALPLNFTATNAAGSASAFVASPQDPEYIGYVVRLQWFSWIPPASLSSSNALRVLIDC